MASGEIASSRSSLVFKQSRLLVIISIVLLSILAWGYLVRFGGHTPFGISQGHTDHGHHSTGFFFVFVMWAVMMVGMMLPTAAPTILMHNTMVRKKGSNSDQVLSTLIFLAGYLVIWTVYSGFAAAGQLLLQRMALVSIPAAKSTPVVSAILLIAAGIFQFTPLKYACLKHCRSPMGFFMLHWREGQVGAFYMGLKSGFYCVGCCWALMVLMFVAGAMNVIWMALLALYILVEKLIPWGRQFTQIAGVAMVVWGIGMVTLV